MSRDFRIPANIREQKLDTLSILEESFFIYGPDNIRLDGAFYDIDYINAKIVLTIPEYWLDDSLRVSYKVWPINFASPIFLRDQSYKNNLQPGEELLRPLPGFHSTRPGLLGLEGLQSSGSISRGITMGNRRDASLRSDMNLQLSGRLTEDIEILAAISDHDIPFQPDGYTQQIQDFDRVFIQLSGHNSSLVAGDFEIERPKGYFMTLSRKVRGASVTHSSNTDILSRQGYIRAVASAAISRGEYARNVFSGVEGSQGPYRLEGNNNETFIIVIAGSEKVFVDGELMIRGMEHDYIIDYNLAEITFTTSRLITRNSRIVVEFEYAERNFARSALFSATEVELKNSSFWINFFGEQDHRNQPLFQDLTYERRRLMSVAGDSLHAVFARDVDSTGFQSNRVMYMMTDSLGFDSVFVFSSDPRLAVYQPRFAYVGEGKGNYRQINSSANGRVFQWVAPQGGVLQGTHEPVVLLVTPKLHQMLTMGGQKNISPNTLLNMELAFSNNDINLFSEIHKQDDRGSAIKIEISDTRGTRAGQGDDWRYTTRAKWVSSGQWFRPLGRYRNVEFERDWNIPALDSREAEHQSEISFMAQHPGIGQINYSLGLLLRGNSYTGIKNALNINLNSKRSRIEYTGSLLNSSGTHETFFYRHYTLLAHDTRLTTVGVNHRMEYNKVFLPYSSLLSDRSALFSEWEIFAANPINSQNQYRFFFKFRDDHLPVSQAFEKASASKDLGINYRYQQNPDHRFGIQIVYRNLNLRRRYIQTDPGGQTINARADYNSRWANGAITSNLFFEGASGREQKREFIYVEVPYGQGAFVWNDYNGDNLLGLDEFEAAPFPHEANFIRVFVPTRQFVPVYRNIFSQSLIIDPAVLWRGYKGVRGGLSRFSNRLNYRIDNRRLGGLTLNNFNPFRGNISDTLLISTNLSFRNSLAFNRHDPKYTIEWVWQANRTKQLLSNGFEMLHSGLHSILARWNISRGYSINLKASMGEDKTRSEFFSQRNFNIRSVNITPAISYQRGMNLRITLFFETGMKENLEGDYTEMAIKNIAGLETRISMPVRGSINIRYEMAKIRYPYPENTPVGFKILQGMRPGTNHLWHINWQHNLNRFLQLSLSYNGRKPTGSEAIHTGSVNVRALF